MIEELCNEIGNRDKYAADYQDDVRDLLYFYMNDQKQEQSDAMQDFITGLILAGLIRMTGAPTFLISSILEDAISAPAGTAGKLLDKMTILLAGVASEKPNELVTTAKYVSNIFQNHEPELIIAYMQAQDPNYVNAYNEGNGTGYYFLSKRDNCDFIRGSYDGYNDIAVFAPDQEDDHPLPDKGGENFRVLLNVDGALLGRSDVTRSVPGYAAGYYSYLTGEKMELFFPADGFYRIAARSYSKMISRTISYRVSLERFTLPNTPDFKQNIRKYSETFSLVSSRNVLNVYFGRDADE